jgi:hypothetical protein
MGKMGNGDENECQEKCQETPPTLSPKKWISLNPSLAIRPSAYVLSHPARCQRRRTIPMMHPRNVFGARITGDGTP